MKRMIITVSTLAVALAGLLGCNDPISVNGTPEDESLSFVAPNPVFPGYDNWATCTGEPSLIIRNGPGPNYAVSTVKPSCKYGEIAWVHGTVIASNGRLYARLPGWGTYLDSDGRRYGFADARWFNEGYLLSLKELIDIVKKQKVCTESFEYRKFLFNNQSDALDAAIVLNGFHARTEWNRKQGKSDSQIANDIFTLIGTVPIIGNIVSIMKSALESASIQAGGGEWRVGREGPFYSVYFLCW